MEIYIVVEEYEENVSTVEDLMAVGTDLELLKEMYAQGFAYHIFSYNPELMGTTASHSQLRLVCYRDGDKWVDQEGERVEL